ncbi:hypothetical protein IC757_08135 [Wenzhouxiangella sp. AB-CW3]|uniref:hypothetical protein n=1 Tax=Wenzhouxiangella sp. AB-CW3 TaxID=2771012 RepID=UPI00168B75BE|nr:hypothetical protein [Wenzhouxiangella sp. AB-CW3]QOC24058.1 hypothetical protein IC757_08135 [Wenzhouxiangella sp. AB-CW3]
MQGIKNILRGSTGLLVALVVSMSLALPLQASERINISAGAHHEGTVETRNSAISIDDGARIDGDVRSRNGSVSLGDQVVASDISTRNGGVRTGRDGQFGRISTRNGSISIGDGTHAERLGTRNGSLSIGRDSIIDNGVRTRNGSISVDSNVRVTEEVRTRNGRIHIKSGSEVSGPVSTRNGDIELQGAHVTSLQTLSGDMIVRDNSRVDGDVTIEITIDHSGRRGGFFGLGSARTYPEAGSVRILGGSEVRGDIVITLPEDYTEDLPTVEVDADSHVLGNLRIDERVNLVVNGRIDGRIERT